MNPKRLLIPFSSRNYRLFFSGQIVSLVGSWMTQTATVWLVYDLTKSAFWLGWVAFLGQIPIVLLAPYAGVCVDRMDRMKLLKITQVLSMLQTFLLAFFTLTNQINITVLTVLAVVQGVIGAFDMPTRQSLVIHLVEKREHMASVIGLNSSMFNIARLIGPGLAGYVIHVVGVGYCFLIDAISYGAVLAALSFMHITPYVRREKIESVWSEFHQGIRYAMGFGPIRKIIVIVAGFAVFSLSFGVLIPVYAQKVYTGDARMLGLLMSSVAVGSVMAALFLAYRQKLKGLSNIVVSGAVILGLSLLVFSFSRNLTLAMICLALSGLGNILIMASNNTLVQNLVDEAKRGRVLSLYGMAFLGGLPLGSLLIGSLAEWTNVGIATAFCGVSSLVLAFVFYRQLPTFKAEARKALQTRVDVTSSIVGE